MNIKNLTSGSRMETARLGNFSVIEYGADKSVSAFNAQAQYFMSKMGVRKRQVVIELNGQNTAVIQAGAMQWMAGHIEVATGVKSAGDLVGKMFRAAVTNETAIKPEYKGSGLLVLEPTYKYILLKNVAEWGSGIVIEDGMFLACDGTVQQSVTARKNISSAVLGGEGLFNLCLSGNGIAALESNVPESELIEIELQNDELKVDGPYAVCWSASLSFTVERTTKTLIGSAASGEGLVNVYRGTGKVLLAPVTDTRSFAAATN